MKERTDERMRVYRERLKMDTQDRIREMRAWSREVQDIELNGERVQMTAVQIALPVV